MPFEFSPYKLVYGGEALGYAEGHTVLVPRALPGERLEVETIRVAKGVVHATPLHILEAAPGLVVVDEAYYAFTDASFIPLLARYPNLLVMRTFSKLGMAGLRLGFLAGGKQWLEQLEKLRLPYNVGVLPQLVAEVLLDHHPVLERQAAQIREDRAWLYERLVGTVDVRAYPSEANFILFRVAHAGRVFEGMKQRGILIKNLHGAQPALDNCLRVTVGTQEQNEQFMVALQQCLHHLAES